MHLKIHNGTALGSRSSLCATCRHSMITRGQTLDEEIVWCQATPTSLLRVTFKVTSCTEYMNEKDRTYFEMLQEAWILQPGSKKRPAGFVKASELRQDEVEKIVAQLGQHGEEE